MMMQQWMWLEVVWFDETSHASDVTCIRRHMHQTSHASDVTRWLSVMCNTSSQVWVAHISFVIIFIICVFVEMDYNTLSFVVLDCSVSKWCDVTQQCQLVVCSMGLQTLEMTWLHHVNTLSTGCLWCWTTDTWDDMTSHCQHTVNWLSVVLN